MRLLMISVWKIMHVFRTECGNVPMKQLYEEVQLCYLNLQIPCLKLQFLQDGISCYKSGLWNEGNGILDWLYLAQDRDR